MIPVKLSLRNFMCYRDSVPPLSFENMHVACLCGDNGNGKSAIFDAITWALWGKSRAKTDDDLIHLGQTEAEVELEFLSGEQRYRVIRKHTKRSSQSRTGQTMLELQLACNGNFKPISGNKRQETQQKIIELLNLDYETFNNSAFLRQGHSDEFSTKRPGQRKEILANILGLSHYDALEKKAKDLATQRRTEADALRSTITEIGLQLIHKPDCETTVNRMEQEISKLEQRKKDEEAIISDLRTKKEAIEVKKEQLSYTRTHLDEVKNELERWQARAKEHQKRIAEYEQVLAEKESIQKGYAGFLETKRLNDDLNRKLSQLLTLKEQMSNLEKVIQRAAETLNVERKITLSQLTEKEAKFAKVCELEEMLTQTRHRLTELTNLEHAVTQKRGQIQQVRARMSYLVSNSLQLEKELAELEEKRKLLARSDVRCPLCETTLGTDGRQRIEEKLAAEAGEKMKARRNIDEELNENKALLRALEDELAKQESSLERERTIWQSRLSIIEKELAEAREAGEELVQHKIKLQELEQRLTEKAYAFTEQQMLLQLQNEEQTLGYSKDRHQQAQQQLASLQRFESLQQRLDEAIKDIDREKAALVEAEETISKLKGTLEADLKKINLLIAETSTLPDIVTRLTEVEQGYQTLLKSERQLRDELAGARERLRHIAELELIVNEKQQALQNATYEESIYSQLAEAFGKKGVQALLIEQALPEIEMEANRLLAKMTDNRMSLALETQRETKKGDAIETLDIRIADELGTRNYEMYSGGEAFRIDFALRIALSKLLVRRAGASLPILIIDEGFGTQDSSGRERLVEAISSIQDDFEKIFVITHLEELKDKFPVLINVSKTTNGSTISIS